MIMNAFNLLCELMTFVILVLFMVLIVKFLQIVLGLLPLILMFLKKSGTSIMHLINILLIMFLLEIFNFILLIVFCLNLIFSFYESTFSCQCQDSVKARSPELQLCMCSPWNR
jgi:hypothetical protein